MSDTHENPEIPEIPDAVAEPRRRFGIQLVWIIPIVAACIGLSIGINAILNRGQTITISFKTGEGLEAGKTKIKYKDVEIGQVKEIAIAKDRSHVIVTAEMSKDAKGLLVQDTRFYVVRARISGGGITGLSTLIGGSYIGVDTGTSKEPREDFTGLEVPPPVSMEVPGRQFVLHAADAGSIDTLAPIFLRRMQVGHVIGTELDRDGKGVTIRAFVRAPYDQFVKGNSIFWHASGVDLSLNASGIKVNTESLASILLGGIAFQTPDDQAGAPEAAQNAVFTLFQTREEALQHAERTESYTLIFRESVRGLAVGAPVDLYGVTVGDVTKIDVALSSRGADISIPVEIRLYPDRLQSRNAKLKPQQPVDSHSLLDRLVAHGFRAEIKSASLVTGQLYIALDFYPKAKKEKIDWSADPPRFPTVPGTMGELQKQLMKIVQKFENVPLDELGSDARKTVQSLDATLKSADRLLNNVDRSVVPEARSTIVEARKSLEGVRSALEDIRSTLGEARGALHGANQTLSESGSLQLDLRQTLREVSRAAQSLRVLGDYLEQHPESLIRGKQEDKP